MRHWSILPLLALVLAASPLGAARPAALAGEYSLQGVQGTDSELLMSADGRFQWYSSHGETELFAEGSWDAAAGAVILTADKADKEAPPSSFETLKLQLRDGRLIPPDGRGSYGKKAGP